MSAIEAVTFEKDRLRVFIKDCLDTVVNAAAAIGVVLPSRQIIGVGLVPSDCEQVVATLIQVNTGAPEGISRAGAGTYPSPGANNTLYVATVNLVITRTTATMMSGGEGATPPGPDAYLTNLKNIDADIAVLLTAADAIQAGQIVGAVPRAVTPANPMGGLLSVTCRVSSLV